MMALFEVKKQKLPTKLFEKYIVPPFSVFNTHAPYWRDRLRFWRDLGLYTNTGRDERLSYDNRRINKHNNHRDWHNGTSYFNPVLTEILIKWFSLPNSQILDPFAGGIVRGGVSAILGREYCGIDLSSKQVETNKEEWENFLQRFTVEKQPEWIAGNSINHPFREADMILTCPPYYNLEKYTDSPEDLSNYPTYERFIEDYTLILERCYNVLRDDCFACIVVSDVRDKQSTAYYGLVADTINICRKVGFKYYNEIILYNDTSNLAIVSGDYLDKARKVGRQHQNILVFYKGDPKNIKDKFGKLELE